MGVSQADFELTPGSENRKGNRQFNAISVARSQKKQSYPITRLTLAALSPLGPCWHSNSTESPSFSVL